MISTRTYHPHLFYQDTSDMPQAITVYDTDDCQLTDKVRKIADLRGEHVSMNDVVREYLRGPVEHELREWERVERTIARLGEMEDHHLERKENQMLDADREGWLPPAKAHLLEEIQSELKRRSTPTIG